MNVLLAGWDKCEAEKAEKVKFKSGICHIERMEAILEYCGGICKNSSVSDKSQYTLGIWEYVVVKKILCNCLQLVTGKLGCAAEYSLNRAYNNEYTKIRSSPI